MFCFLTYKRRKCSPMATQKHLTLEDRYAIQHALEKRHSFRTIARSLGKDPTTISKEVRRHRQSRYYVGQGRIPNRCIHRQHCTITSLCANKKCRKASCNLCNQLLPKDTSFLFHYEHFPKLSIPLTPLGESF